MLLNEPEVLDLEGKSLSENDLEERTEQLRRLVKENKNLIKLRNDSPFMRRFLHACAFNVEASHKKLLEFHKFLTEQKDWIAVNPPEDVTNFLDMKIMCILPQVDRAGRRLCLSRMRNTNPSKISLTEYARIQDLWFESILDDPLVQARGICLIADVSGFSWKLLTWMTPFNLKKLARRLENVVAKELFIHVVKSAEVVNLAIKIAMPFMSAKIKEQLKFHFDDLTSLHQYISPENLPKEYGGETNLDFDDLNRQLLERNNELAVKLEHYRLICTNDAKK